MKKLIGILFLVVVLVSGFVGDVDAGFGDKFKSFTSGAKEASKRLSNTAVSAQKKWKESEKRCDICGKTIHGRSRCYLCHSKKVSKKVKKTAVSAQNKWKESERQCNNCGKKIHGRSRCYSCHSKRVSKRGGSDYKKVISKIKDPENRRKAAEITNAIVETRKKIKGAKKKSVYKGLSLLAGLSVSDDGKTLGEMTTEKLSQKYPELSNSGLFDDPPEAVTAVICKDPVFFLEEVRIINKNGRNVSVCDAIDSSRGQDRVNYLKVFEAVASFKSGDTVDGLIDSIEAVNR